MKLNMAVIDQREAELSEERLAEARAYMIANRQAIVDATIKSILGSMAVAEVKPMKIDWGTKAYNELSYDAKKRILELEGLKTMGAFL